MNPLRRTRRAAAVATAATFVWQRASCDPSTLTNAYMSFYFPVGFYQTDSSDPRVLICAAKSQVALIISTGHPKIAQTAPILTACGGGFRVNIFFHYAGSRFSILVNSSKSGCRIGDLPQLCKSALKPCAMHTHSTIYHDLLFPGLSRTTNPFTIEFT